jgi:energy-coupling factor transporter transmembrane protein EcfT
MLIFNLGHVSTDQMISLVHDKSKIGWVHKSIKYIKIILACIVVFFIAPWEFCVVYVLVLKRFVRES